MAIPRSRSALSVLLSYAVMTCSGAVVAAVTLPFATAESIAQYFWVFLLLPVALVLLSPPVLNRMLRLVLRLARRSELEQRRELRGPGPHHGLGRGRLVVQRARWSTC